jgi:hypothetical protein
MDGVRAVAILRSTAPSSRSDKRFHYELRVTGAGTANLTRFQAGLERTSKREPVGFSLTHEALGKFLDDVTDCLA